MDSERENFKNELREALDDHESQVERVKVVTALVPALAEAGQILWVGGSMFGPDRVSGQSPFSFGSDASVGLATVVQVGAELMKGVVALLADGNRYASLALLRQLVEVEYLAWAFAENESQASGWLRSTREERIKMWQPRHLRERSKGRFRAKDYGLHCELGGHPSPIEARKALPDHSIGISADFCWCEAALHGTSIWDYICRAAEKLGYAETLRVPHTSENLAATIEHWRITDLMLAVRRKIDSSGVQES